MLHLFFDFDGVLSQECVQDFCMKLRKPGVSVTCITTRNEKNAKEVFEVCDKLKLSCMVLGDVIDNGSFTCKADAIAMKRRFANADETFILFDNDPNEIIAAFKIGMLAFLVPSFLTEDMFGEDIDELFQKVRM